MQKIALLFDQLSGNKVCCRLCAHKCTIPENAFGICGIRKNIAGKLYSLIYGELIAEHVDPIEKKPLYHFLPGSKSYSIASIGCNFKCSFCQNWQISQVNKRGSSPELEFTTPETVIQNAVKYKCASISYTYTEPAMFLEYALDTAKLATGSGLRNVFVTNGFMTPETINLISPYLDAANIDLKSFSDDFYRKTCHGRLEPVLNSIRHLKANNIWIEITTLLIPGINDSESELTAIAEFIASLSQSIPWHISRFHPDYKLTDAGGTPVETLNKAYEIGRKAGLEYIYLGNTAQEINTCCPKCGESLIARNYFNIEYNNIIFGKCPKCGQKINGIW